MHERKEVCGCDEKVQPQTSLCLFIRSFKHVFETVRKSL